MSNETEATGQSVRTPSPQDVEHIRGIVRSMAVGEMVGTAVGAVFSLVLLAVFAGGAYMLIGSGGRRHRSHFYAPSVQGMVIAILFAWAVALFLGYQLRSNQRVSRPSDSPTLDTDWVKPILGFVGGSLWGLVDAIRRGGEPNAREQHVATILLAFCVANPQAPAEAVLEAARRHDRTIIEAELKQMVAFLRAKDWLVGDSLAIGDAFAGRL